MTHEDAMDHQKDSAEQAEADQAYLESLPAEVARLKAECQSINECAEAWERSSSGYKSLLAAEEEKVARLREALNIMTKHAEMFNRDTDTVWVGIKSMADHALSETNPMTVYRRGMCKLAASFAEQFPLFKSAADPKGAI